MEAQEERVLARVEQQVKDMVREQLRAAGFDSKLSAGDLTTIGGKGNDSTSRTYASAAASGNSGAASNPQSKTQRQESKFWECRRSLRLWPVPSAEDLHENLKDFLKNKLALEDSFFEEDMGPVTIKSCLLYTSPSPRDRQKSRMPSSA